MAADVRIDRDPDCVESETHRQENLIPVERFLPILERFSDMFDVPLVAYLPARLGTAFDIGNWPIYIHFFYRITTGVSAANESSVSEVFDYTSSRPLRCWNPHPSQHLSFALTDLRGTLIAHRDKRSIFIDFDFLQSSWDGHEDMLSLILWYLMPRYSSSRGTKAIGELCAEDFRRSLAGGEKAVAFSQFFLESIKRSLNGCADEKDNVSGDIADLEKSYMGSMREIRIKEEYLEWLPGKMLSDEALGEEFDSILRLPDVLRIEVFGRPDLGNDKEKTKIKIFTRQLVQRIPPPPQKGESYDIGSYNINLYPFVEFDPRHAVSAAINIESREPGTHQKQYIAGSTCLGNKPDTGLNYSAAQLWAIASMFPLTKLVLTFLKYDTKRPNPKPMYGWGESKPLSSSVSELSGEEYGLERNRYIELMKRVRQSRLDRSVFKVLTELKEQAAVNLSGLYQKRVRIAELETFFLFLREKLGTAREESSRVFQELVAHPAVLGVEMKGGLRVWLYGGENINFPRLLWITPAGLLRVLSADDFNGKISNHGFAFKSCGEEEAIRRFLAGGDYVQALNAILVHMQKFVQEGG